MEQLFLVRHAEADWNSERRLQGHADRPLSVRGREQAVALGAHLRDTHFDAVFCSDLQRTRDTTVMAGFAHATVDRLWREYDVGSWSGRLVKDIVAVEGDAYFRWRSGEHQPPGGESWATFEARVRAGLAVLESVRGRVLLVTHSGVIRAIMKMMLGVSPGALAPVGHASISVLDVTTEPNVIRYDLRPEPIEESVLD